MPFKRFLNFLTSLRLTVACLCLGLVLVFIGTLAQVDLGLYKAQNEFFRSFFVYWTPKGGNWKIPVFPGGYLVGTVLLANLIAAHIKRFRFEAKKTGIWMIHSGLILMLLGQLLTDVLSHESRMHIRVGSSSNYSESVADFELAVVETTDPQSDKVVAIPQSVLVHEKEIRHPELPFSIELTKLFPNSELSLSNAPGFLATPAISPGEPAVWVREIPLVTTTDSRDVPSAMLEIKTPQGSLGARFVSAHLSLANNLALGNRTFEIALRPKRSYKPFSLYLEKFNHGIYKGTDIAKDFSSLVRLHRPETGEDREVRIYMNNPLRYNGETYYQADWDHNDDLGTILQVVHNPSWLTPYFSCALVGFGMLVQFGMHLYGFINKRLHT